MLVLDVRKEPLKPFLNAKKKVVKGLVKIVSRFINFMFSFGALLFIITVEAIFIVLTWGMPVESEAKQYIRAWVMEKQAKRYGLA